MMRSAKMGRRRNWVAVLLAAGLLHCAGAPVQARGDGVEPAPMPEASALVTALLKASYLTAEEARQKRVFFGRWEKDDLNTPALAAKASLMRGAWDDPSLSSPEADALDRAEALVRRGLGDEAIALAQGANLRAVRIRAQAMESLGRYERAAEEAKAALDAVVGGVISDPAEAVEGVRLVAMRVRLKGPVGADGQGKQGPAADFHGLMNILGDVRTKLDRQYWPAILAEAELLAARDNKPKAQEALTEVLTLNPSCADAWALLGRMLVEAFSFDKAESVALRLHLLAGDAYDAESPDDNPAGVSAQGAAIVARAMLRQIDGAQAQSVLEPALAKYPSSPELTALRAASAALRFDEAALKRELEAFDKAFPGSMTAHHDVGRALAEARQYAQAAQHLEEAGRRLPSAPEPWIDLGLLEIQAGRDDRALTALEKAFELDPFNVRADNSLRLVRELATYERIESPNFVVRYKGVKAGTPPVPAPDEILAREMPEVLEENFRIVTGSQPGGIDHRLPEGTRTMIDLMPNHEWFGVRIAGMPRIHTVAASTGPIIAMESPRDGPGQSGPYDWARVVRHEYVHTITLSRTNYRIPHWFTEASATYLELGPRDYATCQMLARAVDTGTLFDFGYLNLAFVRPKKPQDRGMAYAQGEWMYSYMIERYGARSPLRLMDEYAKGVREEEAFVNVLGTSRAAFFEEFSAWARKQAESWGLLLPKGVSSVSELLARETKDAGKDEAGESKRARAHEGPSADLITKWLADHPTHPDVLELAVDQAIAQTGGRATPANAELIERLAAARPVDPKPHRLLARMYLESSAADPSRLASEGRKAIAHLEFLDAREQKAPAYAVEIAKRYAALGEFDKAKAAVVRATRLAPFVAGVREAAATVAIQAKDYELAERQLRALAQIEPTRDLHAQRIEALKQLRAREGK